MQFKIDEKISYIILYSAKNISIANLQINFQYRVQKSIKSDLISNYLKQPQKNYRKQ